MTERWTFDAAVDFLRAALPPADLLTLQDGAVEKVARHALAVREASPWAVPEDLFAAYVLFPRVNDENPEFYHEILYRQLRDRLRGLDMAAAALEVNRWCFERATYRSTDARTANALTVMRRGFGRCGEESVLLVSALRACGLPARQLYAPWWSHCDDNHAWVEVWTGDGWHYLGACEPETRLDSGWFTAAASRAMLVRARAWGLLPEGDIAEGREGGAWIVNRTPAYAEARPFTVSVVENGAPRPGLRVRFEVCNMAQWRPLCVKTTDAGGRAGLLCGLGSLRVRVTDGVRSVVKDVDTAETDACPLDFGAARPFAPGIFPFSQRPPEETRMQPQPDDPAAARALSAWMAAHSARPAMAEPAADGDDARALLQSLTEKDLSDVAPAVLEDALSAALPFKGRYPYEIWVEGVLCPRVAREMLYPVRRRLAAMLGGVDTPEALWAFIRSRVIPRPMFPEGLVPDLAAALAAGVGSEATRDMLFAASARALGIAARLDPVTGVKQVWRDGAWAALLPEDVPSAALTLVNRSETALLPEVHFSVARVDGEAIHPLDLSGTELTHRLTLHLRPGNWRVTVCARRIDGAVEGVDHYITLSPGDAAECPVHLPDLRTGDVLRRAVLPPLRLADGTELPGALGGRPAIVALIAPGQEPTEHFLNELKACGAALERSGIAVRLIVEDLDAPDPAALRRWRALMQARELRLPFAVAVGRDGRGLFALVNYRVGSVLALIDVIAAEGGAP